MKRFITIVSLVLIPCSLLFAQREASDVRKGNREYKKQNFTEAEIDYRKAALKEMDEK